MAQANSFEQDVQIAQETFAKGDLKHAMNHIAWALSIQPENPEAFDILEKIFAATPDPAALLPDMHNGANMSTAEAAVHTELLARHGEITNALVLLTKIVDLMPHVGYSVWASRWLETSPLLDPALIAAFASRIITKFPGDVIPSQQERERVEIFLRGLDSYLARIEASGEPPSANILSIQSGLLRKLGYKEAALEKALASYALLKNTQTVLTLAYAYRAGNDFDKAIQHFNEALAIDPKFVEIYNDLGDMLVDMNRHADALQAYSKMLDARPEENWAAPSYYYLQYLADQDRYWLNKLDGFLTAHPGNRRATDLRRLLAPEGVAYVDYLPEPSEATINILRQFLENFAKDGKPPSDDIKIGLSSLEAPSSRLAFEIAMREIASDVQIIVEVATVQKPDPRKNRGSDDGITLWKYNGIHPAPAMPPPAPDIADGIGQIAASPYSLAAWGQAGKTLASQVGEKALNDLLSVMTHPPARPDALREQIPIWSWIYRVQVAATLTIAGLSADWERPIQKKGLFSKSSEPAPRKKALEELLVAQMDWAVSAACIALLFIAQNEPALEKSIGKGLLHVFHLPHPRPGYVSYMDALVNCTLQLPSTSSAFHSKLQKALE